MYVYIFIFHWHLCKAIKRDWWTTIFQQSLEICRRLKEKDKHNKTRGDGTSETCSDLPGHAYPITSATGGGIVPTCRISSHNGRIRHFVRHSRLCCLKWKAFNVWVFVSLSASPRSPMHLQQLNIVPKNNRAALLLAGVGTLLELGSLLVYTAPFSL